MERDFRDKNKDDNGTVDSINLKPYDTYTGNRNDIEFAKKVVGTTYHIKTGYDLGAGLDINVKQFSLQKAKIVNLGRPTFHTFVIRTPKQRGTYSKTGEEDVFLLSGKRKDKDSDNKANLY